MKYVLAGLLVAEALKLLGIVHYGLTAVRKFWGGF